MAITFVFDELGTNEQRHWNRIETRNKHKQKFSKSDHVWRSYFRFWNKNKPRTIAEAIEAITRGRHHPRAVEAATAPGHC